MNDPARTLLCAACFGLCLRGPASAPAEALRAARVRVQEAAAKAGLGFPLAQAEIRIHKEQRSLELWASGQRLRTYHVGLGAQPSADKVREGDHRTPVGRFYVCTRNAASAFHLFLGLSYPHGEAADRGLQTGLISKAQHHAIHEAIRRKQTPPQFTRLGGLVGIHGGGSNSDWTWGCIALGDSEIEELWEACPIGTPVVIEL